MREASCFVHSAGGSALAFRELAKRWPGAGAVYAFEPDSAVPASIEAMADAYRERLLACGVESPLVLAGHSFGALVAYRMAQQLARAGRAPRALVLLDPMLPDADAETLARRGAELSAALGSLAAPAHAGHAPDPAWLARAVSLGRAHWELARAYTLTPYSGKTYWVSPDAPGAGSPWAALCPNLAVVPVGGDHFSMLEPDNLRALLELVAGDVS